VFSCPSVWGPSQSPCYQSQPMYLLAAKMPEGQANRLLAYT
jgi:hypothetical protein